MLIYYADFYFLAYKTDTVNFKKCCYGGKKRNHLLNPDLCVDSGKIIL